MAKTLVITAHGKVNFNQSVKLPFDVVTCSRFGEYHCGKLISFQEISIFSNPLFLYKYVLDSGDNYTNKGNVYEKGIDIPDILLSPLKTNDPVKMFSWQKPYIIEHMTKMCRYELADNPLYSNKITPFNINKITLTEIEHVSSNDKNLSLLANTKIISEYENNYTCLNNILINNHTCSITTNKDKSVFIIDYEQAPLFSSADWSINDFITDLTNFAATNFTELLGADKSSIDIEALIIKACLSD